MIFKTIDADATNLTKKMGLLGKSFNDIKKDYSNGLGITKSLFSTSISESDWKSLQKFNSAIKVTNDGLTKSQRITKAWNENMTGCSIAAKRMGNDLVTGKKKISDVSSAMKTATASTKALEIAMNVFANVGFMLAITAVTKVISELAQAQSNAVETAKEATSAYNDELSSIKDYKEKISELNEELNSGNLSYEETKTKRSELMSIQDELIEKFGTEKSAIESVTEAIGGQVDALDNLNEKSYRDWIAKADDETIWTKLLPWGKSGLDQAIDYMESKKTISFFDMANANSTTQDKYQAPITDEIRSIQEEIDKTIQSKYNLEKEFATFKITGTPEEVKSQLEAIRQDYLDLSKDAFLKNGISSEYWDAYRSEAIDSINDVINQFDEGLEKHQETYKTYIEGMIKYDSEYSDEYATILRKRAELEDAENSGDVEKIQKARQEFMDAIASGIAASESDENIKKYFESLYPELQAEFANWNFEIAINANTDNLKDEAEEIGKQYSATDLLDMVNTEGVQEGEEAFNKLIDKAIEYGVCTDNSSEEVQKLIDLLVELGIVQGNIESDVQHETPISFGLNSDNVSTTMQGLEKIKSLYTQFAEAKEKLSSDSTTKLSFEIQDIEGIKDSLMDANKQLLVSEEEFSNFENVLADQSSTADQIQTAFDSLATSYVNNALEQGNYTEETKELIKTQLELQGATSESADAFVEQQVKISEAYKAIQDAGFTVITIPPEEITKMEQLGIVTAETAEQMRLLAIQEQIKNGTALNTAADCQNLLALASDAGLTTEVIQKLIQLIDIYTSDKAGAYGQGTQDRAMALEKARQLTNDIQNIITNGSEEVKLDFTKTGGGSKSAGSAGKEAADAYLEAFEKELKALDDLKDRGVISEKEYLDRLRALYTRYFKDKKQYLDQYNKYEKQYLDGMYSLYNSALSGITKLMGKRIDVYTEEKEAVISSLEEQKKAAEDAYQAQIDALEEKKKANQEAIDNIQKEIDAINDAADARKRELDLQKAKYELERMQNQRTILQYSEEKGIHYVADTSGIRDARENVADAEREIKIAELEKQKKYYEDINDEIDKQIDALNDLIDKSNEYYDAQIKSMEKYYDSLIKSMEQQKSKWEELADIKEVADAYSAVQQVFGDLGYTVEDVLSGNEQAFEDFRNKYIALMNDMNSNSSFGDGLSYATGKAKEDLGSFLDSTNEVADGLDNLSEKSSAVDGVATSLGNASTSASELSTNTNGLSDNLNGISDSLNNFPTEDKFSGLTTQFTELGKAIREVAKALGIDGEGSVNSLVTALSGISKISLGDEQTGVIAQFNALASAVNAVSSAINGTGGGASSDPQDSKSQSMSAGVTGTSGSITSALDELKAKADEVLGTGGGEDSAGEGTIGQFEQLEQAVKDVSTAIGSGGGEGEESGSKSNGEEDADNLIGAITSLGEQSEETLGESGGEGVIGRFEQFRDVIGEANEHVTGISDGLDAIDGKEVECTIKINIESNGSIPHFAEGTVLGNMNLDSAEYKAKYGSAHVAGTANVQGNWGVREAGKSLVGEEGQELWVHRGTGKFETVGDRGAEFINVQKGDLIFNHEQTKQLLRDGQISSRGKAYANGTVNKPSVLDRLRAQGYEVQKYEWKDMYGNLISPQQMNEAAKAWVSGTYECLTPMNDFKEKIKETVKVIEGANVVNNTMNQQPISVTMGDIHLHEVQDVDGLSKAIIHQMPGKMLQAIHQK